MIADLLFQTLKQIFRTIFSINRVLAMVNKGGGGNKIDQLSNQQVVGPDGQPLSIYPNSLTGTYDNLSGPYATQEFPSTPLAHGFSDIVDNYAGDSTQFPLSNGSTLYQLSGTEIDRASIERARHVFRRKLKVEL